MDVPRDFEHELWKPFTPPPTMSVRWRFSAKNSCVGLRNYQSRRLMDLLRSFDVLTASELEATAEPSLMDVRWRGTHRAAEGNTKHVSNVYVRLGNFLM